MRGYLHGTGWMIAPHLTNQNLLYAANFRRFNPMSIQLEHATLNMEHLTLFDRAIPPPKEPFYRGMTIIDERTQSQAEHTGLFFKEANGTKFIGSPTAGANGDVTNFQIPGNITLFFSGHDVRHIDGSQLQKVGLKPDIEVKPTIEGIRQERDEILDSAVHYLLRL